MNPKIENILYDLLKVYSNTKNYDELKKIVLAEYPNYNFKKVESKYSKYIKKFLRPMGSPFAILAIKSEIEEEQSKDKADIEESKFALQYFLDSNEISAKDKNVSKSMLNLIKH